MTTLRRVATVAIAHELHRQATLREDAFGSDFERDAESILEALETVGIRLPTDAAPSSEGRGVEG